MVTSCYQLIAFSFFLINNIYYNIYSNSLKGSSRELDVELDLDWFSRIMKCLLSLGVEGVSENKKEEVFMGIQ